MNDYLLISGAGLGGWAWGKVWGYLKTPSEHPPRLNERGEVGHVVSINIAGSTGFDIENDLSQMDSVQAIARSADDNRLSQPIIVAHDIASSLAIKAASIMDSRPKRIVMLGGVIPNNGKSMISCMPPWFRYPVELISRIHPLSRDGVKMPKKIVDDIICSGLSAAEVIEVVGLFQRLPHKLLKEPTYINYDNIVCPLSYIVLSEDRLISVPAQQEMARRLGFIEIDEIDSCHAAMLHKPKELSEMIAKYK